MDGGNQVLSKRVLLVPVLLLAGCGGTTANNSVPVISAPDPGTAPTPTPSPSPLPTSGSPIRAMSCTVEDTVRRATRITIAPASGQVAVVAIGSSSTAGNGASSASTNYPFVLQQLLATHRDIAAYAVFNKGVSGDTLVGTQGRLQSDVFNQSPQVVIVQAGTNDAITGQSSAALADFNIRLRAVVSTITAKAPVVLMNGQHYPSEPSNYLDYQAVIEQVGRDLDVPVFDRYALMKSWIDSGRYGYSDILASDSFHPNDLTYRCMANVMAELIVAKTVR